MAQEEKDPGASPYTKAKLPRNAFSTTRRRKTSSSTAMYKKTTFDEGHSWHDVIIDGSDRTGEMPSM
jgi:hypothetical protein